MSHLIGTSLCLDPYCTFFNQLNLNKTFSFLMGCTSVLMPQISSLPINLNHWIFYFFIHFITYMFIFFAPVSFCMISVQQNRTSSDWGNLLHNRIWKFKWLFIQQPTFFWEPCAPLQTPFSQSGLSRWCWLTDHLSHHKIKLWF